MSHELSVKTKRLIISALRKIWLFSSQRAEAKQRAKVKGKKLYTCEQCQQQTDAVQIDHIVPVAPWSSWDEYVAKLFCEPDNLQALCRECHGAKTKRENKARKGKRCKV